MQIERSRSRLTFRKRRRRSTGCLSILFSIVLVIGVGVVGWLSINRLTNPVRPGSTGDLMTSAQNAFSRGDLSGAISLARQVLNDQPTIAARSGCWCGRWSIAATPNITAPPTVTSRCKPPAP